MKTMMKKNPLNLRKTLKSIKESMNRSLSAFKGDPTLESFDSCISIIKDTHLRNTERTSLNRVCDISDWRSPSEIGTIMHSLREDIFIHRKAWEYACCIYGLTTLGVVKPDSVAISVGAGHEKPLYYFSNRIQKMVATDLYDNWGTEEGDPSMLTTPEKFSPFPYNKENLEVWQMSGTDLKFPDCSFDFAFSLSSIEHFGSRENIQKAIHELYRVLKPGGIVCLATELILNKSSHPEFFTVDELKKYFLQSPTEKFSLIGGDFDFRISQSLVMNPIELDREKNLHVSPHIVLRHKDTIFTSVIFFLKKNEPPTENRSIDK